VTIVASVTVVTSWVQVTKWATRSVRCTPIRGSAAPPTSSGDQLSASADSPFRNPFGPVAAPGPDPDLTAALKKSRDLLEQSHHIAHVSKELADAATAALAAEKQETRRLRIALEHALQRNRKMLAAMQAYAKDVDAAFQAVMEEVQAVQKPEDVAESQEEVATLTVLLEEAIAEKDAALRLKEAAKARYAGHMRRCGQGAEPQRLRELLDADSIAGLLEQAGHVCTMVKITADRTAAAALDRSAPPNVRGRLADALATMQEYAEAKSTALAAGRAAGAALANMRSYCQDPSSNALIPHTHVALGEGETVTGNAKMRQARTFPVPDSVRPEGRAVMNAHIRIGSGKPPAPRLHFLDDTGFGTSGMIVVGWVGQHLPNVATN
jgi:hypothetical protein